MGVASGPGKFFGRLATMYIWCVYVYMVCVCIKFFSNQLNKLEQQTKLKLQTVIFCCFLLLPF